MLARRYLTILMILHFDFFFLPDFLGVIPPSPLMVKVRRTLDCGLVFVSLFVCFLELNNVKQIKLSDS